MGGRARTHIRGAFSISLPWLRKVSSLVLFVAKMIKFPV
ncbi:hypothetical protein M080_5218, partial [Bacteroides fragilis str. 3397 T10]